MSSQNTNNDEIDIGQLILLLLSGKWIIVCSVVLFFSLAYVYLKLATPVYKASALIQVEKKQTGLGGFGDLESMFSGETKGSVEIQIMKSRFVIGEVVEDLGLQLVIEPKYFPYVGRYMARTFEKKNKDALNDTFLGFDSYAVGGEELTITQYYIDDNIAPKKFILKSADKGAYNLLSPKGKIIASGVVGELLTIFSGRVSFVVDSLNANQGTEFILNFKRHVDASNHLKSSLEVSEQAKQSGVIELSLEGDDKSYIKNVLEALINSYQSQNLQRFSEEAQKSIQFLEGQIPNTRGQLEMAEKKLNDYRSETSSLDMRLETKAVLDGLINIERQLSQLELKESEISSQYNKNHPVYNTLLEQKSRLEEEKKRIEQSVGSLPETQQELLRLTRDVEVTSQVYLQLLNKMEELKVIKAGTVGSVRILESAEVLTYPVKPRKSFLKMVSIAFGLIFGIIIVVIKLLLSVGVKHPSEVQERIGIPNYGVVPISDTQSEIVKRKQSSGISILASTNKKDISLEAIRSIRTSLHFAMMESDDNIVMLTGPSPGVGKSFISTNLAALIGEAGQRVLIIDADLRRGYINKSFGVNRAPGLSDYISKGDAFENVVHRNILANVDFIATGEIPPNPSELLMSQKFSTFLDKVKAEYDVVVIDTPPTLAVTDAMIVGKQVGTTMVVIKHSGNTLREIEQMKDNADKLGVPIKGYIYNFMDFSSSSGYGRYGYGATQYYNYGYYGLNDDEVQQ